MRLLTLDAVKESIEELVRGANFDHPKAEFVYQDAAADVFRRTEVALQDRIRELRDQLDRTDDHRQREQLLAVIRELERWQSDRSNYVKVNYEESG